MSKIYDGILGLAIGDALGVPVEFESRTVIASCPVLTMQEYGTHHQPAGTWSDDTSLTLALLDSIIVKQGIDYYDIMDKFSAWLLYGEYTATGEVFDVGNATSRAIMNYGRNCEPLKCGGASEFENGNGSLMRILPAAFFLHAHSEFPTDKRMELIHNVSSLTHRHPISLIGCGIYVSIALSILSGKSLLEERIQQGIADAFEYYEKQNWSDISSYLRLKDMTAFKNLSENDIQSSGYVVHTLEAAIWCLLHSDSYKSCVLKAVNLGDDTDTTGAVAGGLAGIYYGVDNISPEWKATVAKREYIKQLCAAFEDCLLGTSNSPDQNRQQLHTLFETQNYTALYQTCAEIIHDMLLVASREEFEDFLNNEGTLKEDIFWLHYSAARKESLLIGGYDEDVTQTVTSFLQQKLPEQLYDSIAPDLYDLYVDLGTRDTLEEKIRICNQTLSSSKYTIRLDCDETYCAGIYFLTVLSNET